MFFNKLDSQNTDIRRGFRDHSHYSSPLSPLMWKAQVPTMFTLAILQDPGLELSLLEASWLSSGAEWISLCTLMVLRFCLFENNTSFPHHSAP